MRGTRWWIGGLPVVAAMAMAGAPAAEAGGGNGLLVSNVDYNCYSLTTGNPYFEPMISAIAGWGAEGEAAVVGQPFSAQISVGVVGRSCSGAEISPTIIPPAGVRVAIDATHPVQWRYPDDNSQGAWNTAGVRPLPLPDGSVKLLADDGQGRTLWPIVNDKPPLQFLVPLVADRELRGAGSGPGQCPDGPPCARTEAGDYLQARVDTSIGTPNVLAPVVALFATPAPPGTGGGGGPAAPGGPSTPGGPAGGGATTPAAGKVKVASSLRAASLRRGLTVKVPSAAKGAKLAIAITVRQGKKTQTIARGVTTAARAGQTAVTVKPTSRGRVLLSRQGAALKATLRLTATGKGLATVTQSAALRIRR
jgi:hypothetical protein